MQLKEHKHRNEQELKLRIAEYNAPTSARSFPYDNFYCNLSFVTDILMSGRERKMCSELKRKICNLCQEEKSMSEFYPHSRMADGFRGECKSCSSSSAKRYQQKYLEKNSKVDRNPENTKFCSRCHEKKELAYFQVDRRGRHGVKSHCKSCESLAYLARRNKNPEEFSERNWEVKIKRVYGIDKSQYETLKTSQGDCCVICKIPAAKLSKRLFVDHCHVTGQVRGLLCDRCNKVLGMVTDSTELLDAMNEYLNKFKKLEIKNSNDNK